MNRRRITGDWNAPSLVDPRYMKGDSEIPTFNESTNDTGGTLDKVEGPIGQKVNIDTRNRWGRGQ